MDAADPWTPSPARITSVRRETPDTFTIELDRPGFRFEPGQFNMLYVFGVGEVPISISGDPEGDGPLVHTIRAVGTVTRAMSVLEKGDTLGIRGPYGRAWPTVLAEGGDLLIVAGGLGIAPVRPILYRAERHRSRFGAVTLLAGARTPEDIPFSRELREVRERGSCRVDLVVDRADRRWKGPVGVVTTLVDRTPIDPSRTIAMICGPEIMMRFAARALEARGLSRERIYVSMERSMKCAIGHCGHCQYGPTFVCKDGPVLRFDSIAERFSRREI